MGLMKRICRKVICVETGETYESVAALALTLGLSKPAVYWHLDPNRRGFVTLRGRHYHYEGQPFRPKKPPARPLSTQGGVVCLETGEVWPSSKSLATAINMSSPSVCKNMRQGRPIKGHHYAYLGRPLPPQHAHTKREDGRRPTICLETGQRFKTLREAGAFAKRAPYAVSYAATTGGCCGGYHFIWQSN